MNAKFAELERKAVEQENQSMKFLTQAETIKVTQAAAQQHLISSIGGEIDKSNKTVALMQTTSNQTLEDIKKEFQSHEAKGKSLQENLEQAFLGIESRLKTMGDKAKEKYDVIKGQLEVTVT